MQAGLWDYEYELRRWPDNRQQQTGIPSLIKIFFIENEVICCMLNIQMTVLRTALIMGRGGWKLSLKTTFLEGKQERTKCAEECTFFSFLSLFFV